MKNYEILLKETFEGGLKHALYSNFSNYSEAILELIDNSVSNRKADNILIINILVSKKDLTIIDRGGKGMNIKELQEFLEWGKIKSRSDQDIGAYSQGGKAAMGYLGRSMVLITSPDSVKEQYRIEDDDLHNYKIKEYRTIRIPTEDEKGQTQIQIKGLSRIIKEDVLKPVLIDTYRPLIENKEIIIKYNGEIIKSIKLPIDETFKKENFSFPVTKTYKGIVPGWVGRLSSKSGIKGGMRCYKRGRLICDREFFSKYDAHYKATLNYLFGEVHLDHVKANTNKTNFDRDSIEWIEVQEKMFEILKPHIDDLLGREIKEPTDEERQRVKDAKELVAEMMKMRKVDLRGNFLDGEQFGQKKPERTENNKIEAIKSDSNGGKHNPKTPSPKDSIGKRRRLKEFMDWDIRDMDESVRSIIDEKDGSKMLVINNLFPGFKKSNGNNLYLIETAAIQLALPEKDEKIPLKEYIKSFDELYGYFCDNLELAKENIKKRKKEV